MLKSAIKNIIICVLAVACGVLALRVWFGSFSVAEIFGGGPAAASRTGGDTWGASAARFIASGRLELNSSIGDSQRFYAHLQLRGEWEYAHTALGQLIEGGDFARHGLGVPADRPSLIMSYNFPMPSTFFREYFGTRPGFLSSHFDYFESVSISPVDNGLEFTFALADEYFVFSLAAPALYLAFRDILEGDDEFYLVQTIGPIISTINPVEGFSLSNTRAHLSYLFPQLPNQSTVNGVWTYSDNRRIARFHSNNVVEFNAVLDPAAISSDFVQAILTAYDLINLSAAINDVVLAGFEYNEDSNRWHFYFDYALSSQLVDLQEIMPTHRGFALEIQVAGSDVVNYRRLLLDFLED